MSNTIVSSGVTSSGVAVTSGNSETVLSGGITISSVLTSGTEYVSSGGLSSATQVNAGGYLIVSAGGSASDTEVNTGGTMVLSGGSAVLSGGGGVVVSSGAVTGGTTVNSGGMLLVSAGGTVSGANIETSGTEIVNAGGEAIGDVVEAAATEYVYSGGLVVSGLVVGTQIVDGGQVSATVINRGAEMLGAGGTATSNTVLFATLTVASGGLASATQIESESFATVSAGGTTIADVIGQNGVETVSAGGLASAATVSAHAMLAVLSGGTASATVIDGGTQMINGATALYTVISSGAMNLVAGGVASNTTISSGGAEYDTDGSTTSTTVFQGGTESVDALATADATTLDGGMQFVSSGGVASATTVSGGSQFVFSGGVANATTVVAGGVQGLTSGGLALNTTIEAGGTLQLGEGTSATLANNVAGFGTILFHGADAFLTVSATLPQSMVEGFAGGDAIILAGLAYNAASSVTASGNTITIAAPGGASDTLNLQGASGDSFELYNAGGGTGLLLGVTPPFSLALSPASDSGVQGDDITNNQTPVITGSGIAGETVTLYNGGSVAGTGTVGAAGTFAITASALAAGSHTLTATATDIGGHISGASGTLTIDIDTTIPPIPAGLALAPASDSGPAGGDTTSITTPQILGGGEAGDTVTLYDGKRIIGTGTVAAGGTWAIIASKLSDSVHTLTATETNVAGNVSPASIPLLLTIEATTTIASEGPPAPASLTLAPASDSGLKGDDITNVTTPDITGTGVAGDTVSLYNGGGVVGTGTVGTAGSWSIVTGLLSPGSHTLTATETDPTGDVSPASGPLTIDIDTSIPPAPGALALAAGTGGGDTTTVTTPQITGTGAAGDSVSLYDSGVVVGTGTVGAGGTWAVTTGTLADGTHTLAATEADIAGNVSPASGTLTITIAAASTLETPPAPGSLALAPASDSGVQGEDVTNVTTPDITGTGVAGDTVSLFDGGTLVGFGTVASAGTWSIVTATLDAGSHRLTATETDPAGTVSAASAPLTITIETATPAAPGGLALAGGGGDATTLTTPQITGDGAAGDIVSLFDSGTVVGSGTVGLGGTWAITTGTLADGVHTLTATESDLAGNLSPASAPLDITIEATSTVGTGGPPAPSALALAPASDSGVQGDDITNVTTPEITGTGIAGDMVSLFDGTTLVGYGSVAGNNGFALTTARLAPGSHALTATETDDAGDVSPASGTLTLTIDTAIPAAPAALALAPGSDTAGNDTTTVTTPQITGSGAAGDTVSLYTAGSVVGTGTVGAGGTWAITTGTLADGTHTLTATEADVAGNVSAASGPLAITIAAASSLDPAPPASLTLDPDSDSGVQGDDVTNVSTPDISGTGAAGDSVSLFDGTALVGTGTVQAGGTWTITTGTLADGTHTLTATESDAFGDVSARSAPLTLTIETATPPAPGTVALAPASRYGSASATDLATPEIVGTGVTGDTVALYDSGAFVGSGSVAAGGTWGIVTGTLDLGSHTITATETDLAGNVSPAAAPLVFTVEAGTTIESTAPPAPTDLTLAPASDSGVPGDDITNVTSPSILGTGVAGDSVTLYDGGNVVGSGTVGAAGTWSITSSPLAAGAHTLTATEADLTGDLSSVSGALVVTIDTTIPPAPAALALVPALDGNAAGSDTTANATPQITGTGVAGDTVTVYDGGIAVGTGIVEGNGTWFVSTSTLSAGDHTITARQTEVAGNVSPLSNALTIDVNPLPPAPSDLALAPGSDSGVQGDDITDVVRPQITGLGAAGDNVVLYDSGSVVGAGTVTAGGSWALTTSTLAIGAHTLTAAETDFVGNVSPLSNALTITIDSTIVAAPTGLTLSAASDSGVQGDDITNVTTPIITGTGVAGDSVLLYDGTTDIGSGFVAENGTWSITASTLAAGNHTLTATETDLAGDVSAHSGTLTVTIDTTTPPTPAGLALAAISDTGVQGDDTTTVVTPEITGIGAPGDTVSLYSGGTIIGTGTVPVNGTFAITTGTLADGSHPITATATDVAGNVSATSGPLTITIQSTTTIAGVAPPAPTGLALAPASDSGVKGDDITNVTTPTITGDGTAGYTVDLYNGGTVVGSGTVAAGGTWSITSSALAPGNHNLTAIQIDLTEDVSAASSPLTVDIDTTIPPVPTALAIAAASRTGGQGSTITSVTTPQIIGVGVAGDTVTLTTGGSVVGTGTVATSESWAITTSSLSLGSHTLVATETDIAGNVSPASAPLAITVQSGTTIESTAPPAPTALTLAPASDSGVQGDDITNVVTPTITGLGGAGDIVSLFDGTTLAATGTVAASGTFVLTAHTLVAGSHTLTATQTTATSSPSPASTALVVTIDTTIPAAPSALALAAASDSGILGDDITDLATPTITGTGSAGDTVNLYDNGAFTGSGTVAAGGTWAIVAGTLTPGSQTLTATESDLAANISPVSGPLGITIVAVPAAPIGLALAAASDSGVQGDDITNVTTPDITGAGVAGDDVTLFDGGTSIGSGYVADNGTWSITATTLAGGSHTLTATETDAYGDGSAASSALTLTIDTTTPTAPTTLALSPASETGGAGSNTTVVTTPLITGGGSIGDTVTLYDGGLVVGTGTVGAGGTWAIITSTLTLGSNSLTARETDVAGNASAASAPLAVTIAATTSIESNPPSPPTDLTLAPGSDSGVQGDDITNVTTPDITGLGAAGDTVTLHDGSSVVGSGTVDAGGTFSIVTSILAAGTNSLTATQTNLTDQVSANSGALAITIDTALPATPTLAETATTTSPGEPVLQGTAPTGDTVTIDANGTAAGTTVATSGGFQFSFPTILAAGTYALTATATDIAGNASAASPALTVVAQSDGAYTATMAPSNGTTASRGYASSGILDETDSASAGQTVSTIYDAAGSAVATVTQSVSLAAGTQLVGTSTESGDVYGLTAASATVVDNGRDTIVAGGADTVIPNGPIVAGSGADTIFANGASTSVLGGSGTLALFSGSGSTTVSGGTGAATLFGGAGGGSLQGGSAGHNVLVAGGGNTMLQAGGSGDLLSGGNSGSTTIEMDGQDTAYAGAGSATIYGGSSDLLVGGGGSSLLLANGGDDTVWAGTGSSTIFGGAGGTVFTGSGSPLVIDDSTPGTSDAVIAGSGNSTVYGGAGSDIFFATGGGAMTLTEGSGTEELVFGSGPTTVTGGSGTDLYDVNAGVAGGAYVIAGFKTGTDQIRLFGYGGQTPQQSASGGNLTLTLSDNTRITLLNITELGGNSIVS